ncbi:MAG: hypothetical protein PHD48_01270 [Alphaproteobacteria bacterium]|nr:hypothetical protein [Alphaproteobacteria bacterium]
MTAPMPSTKMQTPDGTAKPRKAAPKPTLSHEDAHYMTMTITPSLRQACTEMMTGVTKPSAGCVCQEHQSGHVPPFPEVFDPFNQKGRKHLASAISWQLGIVCEGKTAAQRAACRAHGQFPCLQS